MNYPRVSIIVLNWNGWQDAIECLESLCRITYPNYDIILVDNASEDDSVEKIKEWAEGKIPVESEFFQYDPEGKPIRYIECTREEAEAGGGREKEIGGAPSNKELILIKNEQNLGGSIAFNTGIKYALGVLDAGYVMLLHNDTIADPGFINELVSVANKETDAGILGAKLFYYEEPQKIWGAGGLINYWKGTAPTRGGGQIDRGQFEDVVEVDWVRTCGVLISSHVLRTIGLLDETFFLMMEDIDICIRAAKQGFKVLFVPKSKVWHKCLSPGGEREVQQAVGSIYYATRYWFVLMDKHWSKLQLASAISFFIVTNGKKLFFSLLRSHRDWNKLKLYLRGVLDYWKERKSYSRKKTIDREP